MQFAILQLQLHFMVLSKHQFTSTQMIKDHAHKEDLVKSLWFWKSIQQQWPFFYRIKGLFSCDLKWKKKTLKKKSGLGGDRAQLFSVKKLQSKLGLILQYIVRIDFL